MTKRSPIAKSSDLAEGGLLRFQTPWEGKSASAFLIRVDGRVRAFLNRCTHREVELDLGANRFFHPAEPNTLLCRAHGATFDARTGACASGMCPEGSSLAPIPVEEIDGVIYRLG